MSDGLHYWNKPHIIPGRGRMEHATKLGPLHGPGLSEEGSGEGYHRLPTQSAPLPSQALPMRPCIVTRQAIFRAQGPYPQFPPAWEVETGLDIWQDLGVHWCQNHCAPVGGPAERQATCPTDPCGPRNGLEEKGGGGKLHYPVPPCVGPPPCKRGTGADAGVVQGCSRQTSPPAFLVE